MSQAAPRLARSAGLFGLATMTSRILGLVRDQVLAFYFGATDAMDAFRVAFKIPNMVRDLFAEGAMSAAFVPTFTHELSTAGKARAFRLANSVVTALVLSTGVMVLLGVLFAEPLVHVYARGFEQTPGKLELTVLMARLMTPFLIMVAVAAVLMGMLNALGHFFVPALAPAMFNVATIAIAVGLIPFASDLGVQPIVLVAVAALVGGFGQLAIQWPPLGREGYRYRPALDFRDPALARVLLLMGPGTLGLAATQVNLLVNTRFAAEYSGAVSALDYAFRIMYLPIGLFGVSIAAASTPALSRMVAEHRLEDLRSTLSSAVGLMLVLNVPATLGLIALSEPIVHLIYERGEFAASDTAATARALRFYAVGLVSYSVVRIVTPAFYALRRSRVPVIASMASVAANVSLAILLVRSLGFAGLALATSLAAVVNASTQLVLLRRELGGVEGRRMLATGAKTLAAAIPMALTAWATERGLRIAFPGTSVVHDVLVLAASISLAVAVLWGAAALLRIREFEEASRLVLGKLGRAIG